MDKKEHVIGLFLDFGKAFDTVNHDILLRKLDHYEISGFKVICLEDNSKI